MTETDAQSVLNCGREHQGLGDGVWILVRFLVAAILLIAAGTKTQQSFSNPAQLLTNSYSSRALAAALVAFEVGVACWLLSGYYTRVIRFVTVACFATFAAVAFLKAAAGEKSCGCFGKATVNPWYIGLMDVAVVIAMCLCRVHICSRESSQARLPRPFAAFAVLLAGTFAFAVATNTRQVEIGTERGNPGAVTTLDPSTWVGKRFPLAEHIDIGPQLMTGDWIVVLYRRDCDTCRKRFPHYRQLAYEQLADRSGAHVALIEVPPYGDGANELDVADAAWILGSLRESRKWLTPVPVEIQLSNGRVTGFKSVDTKQE